VLDVVWLLYASPVWQATFDQARASWDSKTVGSFCEYFKALQELKALPAADVARIIHFVSTPEVGVHILQ